MGVKVAAKQNDEETPLDEVMSAEVERMDGVLGPANGHTFLLMRSEKEVGVDLLDAFLRTKHLERSAAASGGVKARAGSKHKLMVDGKAKFPINDCSDVNDAWALRGHATGVSQSEVESYIRSAAKAEGCSIPGQEEGQATRSTSRELEAQEAVEEAESLTRIGKTISAATAARIRETMDHLGTLLADSNAPAVLPEGVDANMETQDKAGDKKEAHDVELDNTQKVQRGIDRAKKLGFSSVDDLITAYERSQAPRIGSPNETDYGGAPGQPAVTDNLPASGGKTGVASGVADQVGPAGIKDATGAMAKAVGQTAANVKVATEEEELPDIGERIARSIGSSIATALEEGLKPLRESIEKIANEDSRSQPKPFRRGAGPDSDYHLVRRDDGSASVTSENAELQRALEALDPTTRDIVSRQLAVQSHPLVAGQNSKQ